MKINQISVLYKDGYIITHYEISEILDKINAYNALHYPKSKMSIYKLRRYMLGKSNIPSPYKSIQKTRLNEIIGIDKLASVDYGTMYNNFVKTNDYSTRQLIPSSNALMV
jgi:hypothetical protein